MSLYIKLSTNFFTHLKTRRLARKLGEAALWLPPRLWAYCAEHQPDGDLSRYSAEDIAELVGYTGDATSMLQALLDASFIDKDMTLHDWCQHNGFHKNFAERAQKAARARWSKKVDEMTGEEMRQASPKHCLTHAKSMLVASTGKGKPTITDDEWIDSLAKDPTYAGINVAREHGKMLTWCDVNRKEPTRKRFANWLNRVDKPMTSKPRVGVDRITGTQNENYDGSGLDL